MFGSCIIHIVYTVCAKIKKNNSGAKRLIWRICIATWIRKATDTRLILTALLRHQWLCECASALRYTYVYCHCCWCVTFISPSNGPSLLSCWGNFKSVTNPTFSKLGFRSREEASCRQHCRYAQFCLNTGFFFLSCRSCGRHIQKFITFRL